MNCAELLKLVHVCGIRLPPIFVRNRVYFGVTATIPWQGRDSGRGEHVDRKNCDFASIFRVSFSDKSPEYRIVEYFTAISLANLGEIISESIAA